MMVSVPPRVGQTCGGRPGKRRGHTLLELMVALPLMAVILAAASTVVFVAARSRRLSEGLLDRKIESHLIVERILRDIRAAISVAEYTPRTIEITVPDRTGDEQEETLRFEWSGTPGDPILYNMNEDPLVTLADHIHAFDLQYELQTPDLVEGDEGLTLVKFHNDAKKGSMEEWKIESGKWCAQYFLPDLPQDATSWELKQVRLLARSDGDLVGSTLVKITTADASLRPTATVLEEVVLPETELDDNSAWITVEFWTLKNLDPTQGLCIVLAYNGGLGKAARFRYEHDGLNMTPDTHWMSSLDSGLSWSAPGSDDDLRFFVYGTHDGTSAQRQFLRQVRLQVQVGADPQTMAESATNLLNAPEVEPR